MKFLSICTLLAILNGLGISSEFQIIKITVPLILAAELNPSIHQQPVQQAKDCPVYRRCKEAGGSQ